MTWTKGKMARGQKKLPKRKTQPKAFLQRSMGLQKKCYALGKVCSDVKVCLFIERDGELHSFQSHRGWPISPRDIESVDVNSKFQKGPEHFETVAELKAVSTISPIALAHPQPRRFWGPGLVEIIDPGACNSSSWSQQTNCVSSPIPYPDPRYLTHQGNGLSELSTGLRTRRGIWSGVR